MRYAALMMLLAFSFVLQGAAPSPSERKSPSEQEFCKLDKNNDREITFEEFAACEFYKLERVRELPYADPKDMERGRNGKLTDDELKAYLFKKADKNRNTRIDRKEWEEFFDSVKEPGGGLGTVPYERR